MKPRELFERVRTLSPPELRWALAALGVAPFVELSLRALGLERTLRWIEAIPRGALEGRLGVDVSTATRLSAGAFRVAALPGGCLPQSLVQYLLHRVDGRAMRFVVGARRGTGCLEAHAWVEDVERAASAPPGDRAGFEPLLVREIG